MKLPDSGLTPRLRDAAADKSSLDPMAQLLLSWVDGKATVGEIGEMCGLSAELAQKIVADLARRGILEVPGFAGATRSEPPTAEALARDVDDVHRSLEKTNFYDLLGVEPDADRKQLRSAYFTLSKRFHPDRAFGREADDLRRKMEVIFRRMTQAYDVLSNREQRAEYDAYIADQLELWKIEKQLTSALEFEKHLDKSSSVPPGGARSSSAGPVPASRTSKRPARRARPAKARPSAPQRPSVPARDPAHEERRKQWKRQRIGKALQRQLKSSGLMTPSEVGKNKARISQAEIALEQEKYGDATRLLEEVLTCDSKNQTAREMLARAKQGATRELAKGYVRQGLYERRQGDLERSRGSFEKALEVDAQNLDARYQLADLLLQLRSDLPRALSLCKEVVAMGGQRARYFATLGELLLLAKRTVQASEAFRKALALEPENREYKKLLKACRA